MTNKKFVEDAITSLITMWFYDFNISMDLLESTTFDVLDEIKPILENELMDEKSPVDNPLRLGIYLATRHKDSLLDGTPVTSEKIARRAKELARAGMIAQACVTVLEENLFGINDFLEK